MLAPFARALALASLISVSASVGAVAQSPPHSSVTPLAVAQSLLLLREAAGLSASPSGALVAYQVRRANLQANGYDVWWEVASTGDGHRTRVDDRGGDPSWGRVRRNDRPSMFWNTLAARWSPDERWIGYLKSADGAVQVWRARVDGSGAEQVTHDAGDVLDFLWSADGRSIIYSSGPPRTILEAARTAERSQGFLLDDRFDPLQSLEPTRTHDIPPPACCHAIDPDTKQVRQTNENENAYFRVARPLPSMFPSVGVGLLMWTTLAQGEMPPAITHTDGLPDRAQWQRRESDGSSVLLAFADATRQGLRAPMRLFSKANASASYIPCEAAECSGFINEAWRSPNGDVVYFRHEGWDSATSALYAWHEGDAAPRRLLSTFNHFFDCTQAHDHLVCFKEGITAPQTLVSIDMRTGAETMLIDYNPEFVAAAQQQGERLEWRSPGGFADQGYFFRPVGTQHAPYPLVIVQYRARGFLRGGQGDFSPVQAYTRAGLAVLFVDRAEDDELEERVADDMEIERQGWQGLRQRRENQGAIEHVLDLLVQRGDVDPNRIGISGLSDGSVTAVYGISHSRRFRAASIAGGSWEPATYYLSSPAGRQNMAMLGIGAPGSPQDTNWDGISLTRNVQSINTPLLIQTSDREAGDFFQPFVMLQELHKPVEVYVFSDEYHVMWQPIHRMAMYERNIDWFRFWLQDYEDPAPAKADQYRRWRAMRDLPR